ncbi:MAG: helix-hairpin-helix domain-containing protein [Chitinophagaceae bacterium]|nr:MAG: helix-hairpin-helix domain-containing protein [Chitinophagaceae bacterium]
MKKFALSFLLLMTSLCCFPQVPEPELPTTSTTEQQLENITENSEDMETEDDSYLQDIVQFLKNPVNLNRADENTLKDLRILNPMQIQNLIRYRDVLGSLLSIYELQAVPGFDILTIQKLRPYVTVSSTRTAIETFTERFTGGEHSLLLRGTQVLEQSRGFLADTAGVTSSFYPGSPQRLFMRYKYTYKNLLQYGVVGEKDAGEEFFKGTQRQGFDFYSAHLFARNIGIVKSLAIGDFTVNMGQGLTSWMTLAFKKSPDIMSVKRQAPVLKPYSSAGEIFFHRGVGVTVGKKKWEATLFGSYRKLDANFVPADTVNSTDEFISSLQTSGLHRTANEVADKNVQRQVAFGGNVKYRIDRLLLSANAVQYQLRYPLIKASDPANFYALTGKQFGNYSVDYSYTFRNLHFFGEAAVSSKNYGAFVNGLLLSVASNVDMSILYRNISKGYQSLYTNAFTESTYPTNEKGLFTGISIRPNTSWRIDAYADIYKSPWLKFRVNAPSQGKDYMVQVDYKPNKIFEVYTRFKAEAKSINYNPDNLPLAPLVEQPRKNWRTHISYKLDPTFTLRSRAELVWFDKKGAAAAEGFLLYADLLYKPIMKPFSGNIRLMYFETDDYNSRLYAFENDVLYSFSIPVFYDKGYRYYVNLNYDFSKKLAVWARWAQFIYADRSTVGSGLDEIRGNRKTEVKLQLMYKF